MLSALRGRGLRFKIVAWVFIPTAVILLGAGILSFLAFQDTAELLVIERSRELTRVVAGQLVSELADYPNTLVSLAANPDLQGGDGETRRAALKEAENRLNVFDGGVVLLDDHGNVAAAQPARPEILGADWSGRAYFRQVTRSKAPVFSDVSADGPGGSRVTVIAVPIKGPRGELQGTLVGMFRLGASGLSSFYGTLMKLLRVGKSETAYLVDHSGIVIYHTESERIGLDFSALKPVQQVLSGQADSLRTRDVDGREIVSYYCPVPGTPWGLVIEEGWGELLAFYEPYQRTQYLLFGIGILIPMIVVGFGVRRITGPLKVLTDATREVANGKFGRQIEVRTGDEIEELARQFNHMSAELAASYATLKTREERLSLVMNGTNDGFWDWDLKTNEVFFSPRWKSMLGYAEGEISSQFEEWQGRVHPDDLGRALAEVRGHLEGRTAHFELEHRLRHKDGSYRWILARAVALRNAQGEPHRMTGSHTDITRQKEVEQALQLSRQTLERRVEERTHELAALNAIAAVVSRSLNLTEIMQGALDQTMQIMGTEAGGAYRLDENTQTLVKMAHSGLSDDLVRQTSRQSLHEAFADRTYGEGRPIVWQLQTDFSGGPILRLLERQGFRTVLAVPLMVRGTLLGALFLSTRRARTLSPEESSLLMAIGQQVGVAVENARLYDQAERSAAVAERSRLARELHDSVTQSLYSVTLYAEAAARMLTAGRTSDATDHLRELRDTAQDALREMRLLIFELRPLALEKAGLATALQARLDAVEVRGGIQADFEVSGTDRLSRLVQEELYHIAQEALNNVLKHAHAQHVWIRLQFEDAVTRLVVRDDGVGFDQAVLGDRGGLGLAGMRERCQRIGGMLEIASAPGAGTTVTLWVPAVPEGAPRPSPLAA